MLSNKINTTTNPIASDALTIEEISLSLELFSTLICNGPIMNIRKYETTMIIAHMIKMIRNGPNNLIMILCLS